MKTVRVKAFEFLLILILFSSCEHNGLDQQQWNNHFPKYTSIASLQLMGKKVYKLDSVTSLPYPIIQYADYDSLVIGFTTYNRSFVLFDYKSGEPKRKITLSGDPKKGVGTFSTSFSSSFYFINYDSILLFNENQSQIYLVDSAAVIKRSFSLAPKDKSYRQPGITHGELLYFANNHVYLSAAPGRNVFDVSAPLLENLMLDLNLQTGQISTAVKYPDNYGKAFWADQMSIVYTAWNPNKALFLESFPIDHAIYSWQPGSSAMQAHYAGSDSIMHVDPISFSTGKVKPSMEWYDKEMQMFRGQRTYSRILFDKYRNVYYRIVTNAFRNIGQNEKSTPFSIIILDENFTKIGEQNFDPAEYLECSMFVSPDGLCMLRLSSNEDVLRYDVFKLTKRS
jgi:hypothetical protein